MVAFVKGDVVVINFPFSDLSQAKRRPALVVSRLHGIDLILCQITSQFKQDEYAIQLFDKDFKNGTLAKPSNVRPNILFTADSRTIKYRAGQIQRNKLEIIIEKIVEILRR